MNCLHVLLHVRKESYSWLKIVAALLQNGVSVCEKNQVYLAVSKDCDDRDA